MSVKYFHEIPISVCNGNKAKQALQRHTIFLTDYYHGYILEEIELRDKIEYERNIRDDGDEYFLVKTYFVHRAGIYYYSYMCTCMVHLLLSHYVIHFISFIP